MCVSWNAIGSRGFATHPTDIKKALLNGEVEIETQT
jgi:hypothetical protein